ncbi:MAG: beta-lactamase family protein [Phycisphaerales bacterium]|nr:beta-lactamase family protein [Phycisphaerales bacterium]
MRTRTHLHLATAVLLLLSGLLRTSSAQELEALEQFMQGAVARDVVVGCAAQVTLGDETIYLEAHGDLDPDASRPLRTDEVVQIYSMTKPITSVTAMIMAEEGRLRLDDPVSMYIPEFAEVKVAEWPKGVRRTPDNMELVDPRRPLTVRDLILHTAGLAYTFSAGPELQAAYADPWVNAADLDTAIRGVARIPLAAQPGTRFLYGINTDVLGRVIEVAADMPLEEVMQTRLFDPLEMRDTGFAPPPGERYMPIVSRNPDNGRLEVCDQSFPGYARLANPALPLGGQGLHSTLNDYTRFCRMILNGGELDGQRVLSERTVEFITRNQVGPGIEIASPGFGIGFGMNEPVDTSHGPRGGERMGWGGAASTFFFIDPEQDVTAVFFTQQFPFNGSLGEQFTAAVLESMAAIEGAHTSSN